MNPKVAEYIEKQNKKEAEKLAEKKLELAEEFALYEKVYYDGDDHHTEYPFSDWVSDDKYRYYKKVLVHLSDEEYYELLEYKKQDEYRETNPLAVIIKVFAWFIIIGGIIAGFVVIGNKSSLIGVAMICWAGGLVSSLLFFGLS